MARGLMCCAARGEPGEIYNLASGVETSIKDLADIINEFTENPTPVDLKPARDWDRSGKRFGATEKSEREIGFKAEVDIRTGLKRTVQWTKDNSDTIERCMAQHAQFLAN